MAHRRYISRLAHISRHGFHHTYSGSASRHVSRRRTTIRSKARHGRSSRRIVAHRWHMPGLEIPPARAQQIQQALIQDGDLHGLPTGRWDGQTRDAMRLYQHKNGFQATGLPDAKSLMKMGLGPHPLPAQLDPLAQAGAGVSPTGPASGQNALPPQ
ncbi:MAG: peptidoglycan-binding domain-containing protein [Terriglobia bacterium]